MAEFGLIFYNFGKASLQEFLDYAQAEGFNCVEISVGEVWNEATGEERVDEVRRLLEERGLRVSALAARNDFVVLDPAAVERQVTRMQRVCQLARRLGTSLLRTEGGFPKPEVPPERWLEAMAGCLTRLKPFIEGEGFYLAVDNHGLVTNDARLQVELFQRVGSRHVGANLDTMNYRWAGHDLETVRQFYQLIAPYTLHTHFKDGRGSRGQYVGEALGEGEIDLEHAVRCLKQVGYQGVWCVEYEGRGDPREGYRKGLAWLKARV